MAMNFSPVFIGGTGRSGTTITLNLLQRHPQFHASLPREIKFMTSRHGLLDLVYHRPFSVEEDLHGYRFNLVTKVLPLIGRNRMHFFTHNLFGRWWSETGKAGKPRGLVQSIPQEVVQEVYEKFLHSFKADPAGSSREFFYSLAKAQIKNSDIKYFGDSTPVNMMHSHQIQKLLPDARFINVIRDGRDVAQSIAKEAWGPNDPYEGLSWWANRMLKSAQALTKVDKKSVHEYRIEDLVVHDRDNTYKKILDFLKLDDATEIHEYFDATLSAERLHIGSWRTQVKDPERFDAKYKSLCKKLQHKGVEIKDLT
ncbi:MAG: hypothetical protein F2827_00605 [Actinobacteria bacterium]|nr:hypothetical protein [Actinomycetota bacterium]